MMGNTLTCKQMEKTMPDLLFDPAAAPGAARAHLAGCDGCREEWTALQRTIGALGGWEAPEPSPFWNARMGARLREEQVAPARGWAGFTERMRTRLWVSNRTLKPVAGMAALAVMLVAGGGTWLDLASGSSNAGTPVAQASNTVRDLQSLNENAQVFQAMSALDTPDSSGQ